MKIRLTFEEFKEFAMMKIKEKHPTATELTFRKNYAYEPEGDHYDYPDFVDVQLD